MSADTKKDGHMMVKIHYNTSRHEQTPRGRGLARVAGQSCLAGPSVAPAAPWLWALLWMGVWYGTTPDESSLFVQHRPNSSPLQALFFRTLPVHVSFSSPQCTACRQDTNRLK